MIGMCFSWIWQQFTTLLKSRTRKPSHLLRPWSRYKAPHPLKARQLIVWVWIHHFHAHARVPSFSVHQLPRLGVSRVHSVSFLWAHTWLHHLVLLLRPSHHLHTNCSSTRYICEQQSLLPFLRLALRQHVKRVPRSERHVEQFTWYSRLNEHRCPSDSESARAPAAGQSNSINTNQVPEGGDTSMRHHSTYPRRRSVTPYQILDAWSPILRKSLYARELRARWILIVLSFSLITHLSASKSVGFQVKWSSWVFISRSNSLTAAM